MPAYIELGNLHTDALERIRKALDHVRSGYLSRAAELLETLLDGPAALKPLTVAVRVCGCGDFMGTDEWVGDEAHPDAHTITHGMCDACCKKFAAACAAMENAA